MIAEVCNISMPGVLVFAANSLLYLNQSVPPFGVMLNSLAPQTTDFPLQRQGDHMLTLDNSQVQI